MSLNSSRPSRTRLFHAARGLRTGLAILLSLGLLAEMPEDAGVAVLAMQGTFYRAFSLVNGGREIEKDLFEGLREKVQVV